MPFAALKGYEDMARGREFTTLPKHELTAEEARILSDTVSELRKGDFVRVAYYGKGEHRVVEGAVAYKGEAIKTMRVGSLDIAFDDIESIEPL